MSRLTISLNDSEKMALRTLAESEFREPRAQACLIIRRELERLGLLPATESSASQSALRQVQASKNPHNLALKKRTHAGTREGESYVAK
jgi:hypothetical protein